MDKKNFQEIIVNHLKNYGFVYQNSEIYGGLSNSWDFGPLGALMKNNLKKMFVDFFVISEPNMHLIDTNIILNNLVWNASGHTNNFSDPLIDCKNCKNRYRADKLIEQFSDQIVNENTPIEKLEASISLIKCPTCNKSDWTNIRKFNLMFETKIGVLETLKNSVYLRPETAQGIFVNFKNILRTQRNKLPFGVAQIGKSFRNEITPSNFIFRTREFEQMEIEYFIAIEDEDLAFEFLKNKVYCFLTDKLKIAKKNLTIHEYSKNELAHYSKKTIDFFYNFPHGDAELWGISDRGIFDLSQHEQFSKKDLQYHDVITNKKFIPLVIEPSVGVERLLYAIFVDAYCEESINNDVRVVLKLCEAIAPYKICVLPLTNKLNDLGQKFYQNILNKCISSTYDLSGSIGKRYRRQDAIGTPYCITVDFDTEKDNTVTVRERDSTKQVRIKFDEIDFNNLSKLFL